MGGKSSLVSAGVDNQVPRAVDDFRVVCNSFLSIGGRLLPTQAGL